ncbi:glycosyltransferase [Afifella pfennigii]|uniref:glycosyltransferase n=1 Tax=Afifella pfennigii TaxID=209897 RepID=UPI00047B2322|nr:glycosyltransferase [Afifella pfennigii]
MASMSSSNAARRLLVIIPDRVTDILTKGEYQPNYYNPGELFDVVHILSTSQDSPDLQALQRTVGRAELHWHTHPEDPGLIAQNWQSWWKKPLRDWAAPGVETARRIDPHLIRLHGADWNGYLASRIKRKLGIPYVMSLHINPDVNPVRRHVRPPFTPEQERHNAFFEYIEHAGLRSADLVMPVYKPIVPYVQRHGVERFEVCYNILNGPNLREKSDYSRGERFRMVCVGRLVPEKNPDNIIRAVAELPEAELTIVGDGPQRPALEALSAELGVTDRVIFRPAVDNDELCEILPSFDAFVVHTEYWELNKSVLEALLTGLPLVINRRLGPPVPEFEDGDFVHLVENSVESYSHAISWLMRDDAAREDLGRRAYRHAQANWAPAVTEKKVVEIYERFMRGGR